MDGSTLDSDDQRVEELGSIAAIFPEMTIDSIDHFTMSLDVPVKPAQPVFIALPVPGTNGLASPRDPAATAASLRELVYLPSLRLTISIPDGYPDREPPRAAVSTSPAWLPDAVRQRLQDDCSRLWNNLGRNLVMFSYIDYVLQAADDVFGLADVDGLLAVDRQHRVAIMDYDAQARQAAFDGASFSCVCVWKGAVCHRMQDFYSNAITEGDIASVRCLEPKCAKKRQDALQTSRKDRWRRLTALSPGELLQIPLEERLVKRYVDLMYKSAVGADKSTIYCPRPWCAGAARSRRHRRPRGLTLDGVDGDEDDSDEDGDDGGGDGGRNDNDEQRNQLRICEDCDYAFCSICGQSWHGDLVDCTRLKIAAEEASLEYVALNSTARPTCSMATSKTDGCNHMICICCWTHFCYLCSSWLDPDDPFVHFSTAADGTTTECFQKLWEPKSNAARPTAPGSKNDNDGDDDDGRDSARDVTSRRLADQQNGRDNRDRDRNQDPAEWTQYVGVARESPLVLRIAFQPAPEDDHAAVNEHQHDQVAPQDTAVGRGQRPRGRGLEYDHGRGRGFVRERGSHEFGRGCGGRGSRGRGGSARGRGRGRCRDGREGGRLPVALAVNRYMQELFDRVAIERRHDGAGGADVAARVQQRPDLEQWVRGRVQEALVDGGRQQLDDDGKRELLTWWVPCLTSVTKKTT